MNAFNIGDLHDLAARLRADRAPAEVHAVVLRSEGRGFCGGGDLKEVQGLDGFDGILGQASGSYKASLAMAECAVPVIVAVHRYCVGVGVLLAGAADIVVADEAARFVLAEVDNGATGGAIQAAGLMPEKRLRAAMFTCEPVARERARTATAASTASLPPSEVLAGTLEVAAVIAAKPPVVVRRREGVDRTSRSPATSAGCTGSSSATPTSSTCSARPRAARQTFLDGAREGYTATSPEEAAPSSS